MSNEPLPTSPEAWARRILERFGQRLSSPAWGAEGHSLLIETHAR